GRPPARDDCTCTCRPPRARPLVSFSAPDGTDTGNSTAGAPAFRDSNVAWRVRPGTAGTNCCLNTKRSAAGFLPLSAACGPDTATVGDGWSGLPASATCSRLGAAMAAEAPASLASSVHASVVDSVSKLLCGAWISQCTARASPGGT